MTKLRDHLVGLIRDEGPLTVGEYMAISLTAHEDSYYRRGDPFGAAGDFTTAPEVSQIFGELIGLWAVAVWEQLGSPSSFSLIELGPGRGTLMRDALRAARVRPAFLGAADVELVEISPTLRETQREMLENAGARSLSWSEAFKLRVKQPIIIIANEFFDALPIRQFVMTKHGWLERSVELDAAGALAFGTAIGLLPQSLIPSEFHAPREGAIFEFPLDRRVLAHEIGGGLVGNGGAALVIDYGFSGPAVGDTLQAVKAHRFVPVLEEPGHADLTSHVDFAALADGFALGGAATYGPIEQAALIARLGGVERKKKLASKATAEQRQNLDDGYARLTEAAQMGSLFKALAAASPGLLPPGFFAHERR